MLNPRGGGPRLSTEDVTNLGDFLITTAEMLLELEELEVQTRDALARLRGRNWGHSPAPWYARGHLGSTELSKFR